MTPSEQTITSAATDRRQVPALFRIGDKRDYWREGNVNFDLGGGASNRFTRQLARRGVTNLVVDPFNRTSEHNDGVMDQLRRIGGADSATSCNVLNVINAHDVMLMMVATLWTELREGGMAYVTVYEGKGTGEGQKTINGWQHNRPVGDYVHFVTEFFGEENVTLRYPVIQAVKREL